MPKYEYQFYEDYRKCRNHCIIGSTDYDQIEVIIRPDATVAMMVDFLDNIPQILIDKFLHDKGIWCLFEFPREVLMDVTDYINAHKDVARIEVRE